jgi:hypothetical protein
VEEKGLHPDIEKYQGTLTTKDNAIPGLGTLILYGK